MKTIILAILALCLFVPAYADEADDRHQEILDEIEYQTNRMIDAMEQQQIDEINYRIRLRNYYRDLDSYSRWNNTDRIHEEYGN